MSSPRVAVITTGLGTGGAEHMLCKLVEQADGEDISLMVVSLRDESSLGARIRAAGVPLVCCNLPSMRGVAGLLGARRALREFAPTALQGWMYHGSLAASLFAGGMRRRPRVLWSMRQSLYDIHVESPATRFIIGQLARLSGGVDGVVYNSALSRNQHCAAGMRSRDDRVIGNGFDLDRYRPDAGRRAALRERLGIGDAVPLVGIVARVHPVKDHATFIAAAAAVAAAVPSARFVLAGDGTDSAAMKTRLEDAGIYQQCFCLGRVEATETLYPGLDLLVLSSWAEAWPNVLGEAMSCGVPCVATDVGESRLIVDDTGRVVSARDAEALAQACCELLALEPTARSVLATSARDRMAASFSIESVFSAYADLWVGPGNRAASSSGGMA